MTSQNAIHEPGFMNCIGMWGNLLTVKPIGEHQLQNPSENLTQREKEILLLISKGYASKQIADKLQISINTINNHRRHILSKTGCLNTFEAIRYVAGGLL